MEAGCVLWMLWSERHLASEEGSLRRKVAVFSDGCKEGRILWPQWQVWSGGRGMG